MQELIHKARTLASAAHGQINHRRKYSQQPYEVHLRAVAELVASVTDDPEMLAAAWLHDTVEDTPVTLDQVEQEVGPAVAALVADLTDVSRPSDGNRAMRKALDREHSARAAPRAKTIKLADLIDNMRDIVSGDPGFARIFLAEARALLEVLDDGDPHLYALAQRELEQGLATLGHRPLSVVESPFQGEDAFAQDRAVRLFTEAIRARDVAEPLRWFDESRPAPELRDLLRAQRIPVAGILRAGLPLGYCVAAELGNGPCGDAVRPFMGSQVVAADAPLADVIQVLVRHNQCFVTVLGQVGGLITRDGLRQPAVRMWLFGIVTLMELSITRRIRALWPGTAWEERISPGRLDKARQFQQERLRREQACDLLDCLQFVDKARLLFQDPAEQAHFGFRSRKAVERAVKSLESLRNNLAHAQDITAHDWPVIADIAIEIDRVLRAFHSTAS